ncbi:hypothetical protein D3C87_1488930 [compost metagenome]
MFLRIDFTVCHTAGHVRRVAIVSAADIDEDGIAFYNLAVTRACQEEVTGVRARLNHHVKRYGVCAARKHVRHRLTGDFSLRQFLGCQKLMYLLNPHICKAACHLHIADFSFTLNRFQVFDNIGLMKYGFRIQTVLDDLIEL